MTPELRALIKRFVVEAVRREMTDSQLASYDDKSILYAKGEVKEEIAMQIAALHLEDFRG